MPLFAVSIPPATLDQEIILRYVAVDKLQKTDMTGLGEKVECLRLDVGVVERGPFEVLLGQLGVRRVAGVLSNGVDGIRAILWLLGAGNSGQAEQLSARFPRTWRALGGTERAST